MARVTKATSTTKPATPKLRAIPKPRVADAFVEISAEEVAHEAYVLYLERGGSHGDAIGDWLEAERRIRERRTSEPAAKPAPAPRPSRARAASSAR